MIANGDPQFAAASAGFRAMFYEALEKDRARRYETTDDLARELEQRRERLAVQQKELEMLEGRLRRKLEGRDERREESRDDAT